MWKFLETEERRRFDEEMRSAQDAINAAAESHDKLLRTKLADCTKAFEAWLAEIKTVPYDTRPQPAAVLAKLESPTTAVATQKLEAECYAANERANRLQAAYNAAVVENNRLKGNSSRLLYRWGMMLAGCVVGVTAGVSYHAFFDNRSTNAQIVSQAVQQLDDANAELRTVKVDRAKDAQTIVELT